jgi:hypothetical protein
MATNQKAQHKDQAQQTKKTKKPEPQLKQPLNHEQMLEAPETLRQEDVLAAQQQVGNQVVQRALDTKKRRKSLTDKQGYIRSDISDTIQQRRGGGSPLPDTVRSEASKRFKKDFEDVRLHTDDTADKLSRTINARAFTIGKDIFFKKGVFAPGSSQGRETLLHELTHVVQQSGSKGASGRLKLGAPDTAHEQEADRIGKQHKSSDSVSKVTALGSAVQTDLEDEEMMQGQEDEELLQGQDDEEELQMQPDSVGVVQRGIFDIFKSKKDEEPPTPPPAPTIKTYQQPKTGKYGSLQEAVQGIGVKAPETKEGVGKGLGEYSPEERENFTKMAERSKENQTENKKRYSRLALIKDVQDPGKSTEEAKKSEEQLKLHTRSSSPFKQSYARQARVGRLKTLKEQAQIGDEGAIKKLQEAEKGSSGWDKWLASSGKERGAKVMSGVGSGLKGMFGLGKRFMQTGLDSASEQLFGKAPKKEEKAKPESSSGDGGAWAVVAQLMKENKELRDQIGK